ncbi:MAG: hypothetical protein FWD30_01020 [Dehalococcoidia bacterium]|nr:hypothetical protein [Dehalococcoidia bacterium]
MPLSPTLSAPPDVFMPVPDLVHTTSLVRLALVLEYDGTHYAGSQWQPHMATVQSKIEKALNRLTGEDIRVTMPVVPMPACMPKVRWYHLLRHQRLRKRHLSAV